MSGSIRRPALLRERVNPASLEIPLSQLIALPGERRPQVQVHWPLLLLSVMLLVVSVMLVVIPVMMLERQRHRSQKRRQACWQRQSELTLLRTA